MNRAIRARGLSAIYVTGPGHGGPGLITSAYLGGTYSEVYPHNGRDAEGLRRLFRQFSFPGGIPSHVAPEPPGSIHEGGELGYSLLHAYGAVFDDPDLLAVCVVGDGEAETGPLAASWHSNKFLNPARDGTVLLVLHLNGYKIANPTVLARIAESELRSLLEGYGHAPRFFTGSDPEEMHHAMAHTADETVRDLLRCAIRSQSCVRSVVDRRVAGHGPSSADNGVRIRVNPNPRSAFTERCCGMPPMTRGHARTTVPAMDSIRHSPGRDAAAAHRPELYEELRRRNERRARVARLIEARREGNGPIQRPASRQRERRFPQVG